MYQAKNKDKGFSVLENAVMSKGQSLTFAILCFIGCSLTIMFGIWWFNPLHVPHNFMGYLHGFDYLFFIVLTYIVWHQIMMEVFSWYVASYMKHPDCFVAPEDNLRVAYLTAFVPGNEPYHILEKTLRAMVAVDYPHDTWLLDEGNDGIVKEMCLKYGVRHYSRNGRGEFNRESGKFKKKTKGGNYNSWLHHYEHRYDIIVQHDVDFIPKKEFLMRTLGYFRDSDVAFVGTPQIYGNASESWIARGAAEQSYGFYGPMQKGLYGHDMTLLIGANHLIRTSAFLDVEGYSAHITEDMLTGMKFYTHQWKSVYVPEILLIGEGPSTWGAYLSQQMRWAYGCMDIALRHSAELFRDMRYRHITNYVILQQFYLSGVAQVAGIFLLTFYFVFGFNSANMTLMPILILYLPLIIFQVLFQLWLQRFNINPSVERGLLLRARLLSLAAWPVYFLAFVKVLQGRHLTYVVTPKGDNQERGYYPGLFIIHFILGSITFADIIIGCYLGHSAYQLIFWAAINTMFMYYFFFSETLPVAAEYLFKILKQGSYWMGSASANIASKDVLMEETQKNGKKF